ncbi:MAG: hypothetical protein R2771_05700 [Saprospiraceae bacterium]
MIYNKALNDDLISIVLCIFTSGYGYYQQYKTDEDLAEYKLDTNVVKIF